jgi:hypothetical protein
MSPCLHVHVTMYSCLHISMSPFSIYPCFHVFMSISSCFHVSIARSPSPCLHVSLSPCHHVSMSPCLHVHVSMFLQTENGTRGKRQLPFFSWKWKMDTPNFRLFAANGNGKQKFVFLSRQMKNANGRLLFQQTCPSMPVSFVVKKCILTSCSWPMARLMCNLYFC